MTRPRHVVLVGLMGAGKTTVGVPLAPGARTAVRGQRHGARTAHRAHRPRRSPPRTGWTPCIGPSPTTLAATLDRAGTRRHQRVRRPLSPIRRCARGCAPSSSCGSIRNPDALADQFQRSRAPARHRRRPTRLLRGAVREHAHRCTARSPTTCCNPHQEPISTRRSTRSRRPSAAPRPDLEEGRH